MSFGFDPFSGSSSGWGNNDSFSQKDCFLLGGIFGVVLGIVIGWLTPKKYVPLNIPKGIQDAGKKAADETIRRIFSEGLIPESAVGSLPQFMDPQPITQVVDLKEEPYLFLESFYSQGGNRRNCCTCWKW